MIKVLKKSWHNFVAAFLIMAVLASPGILGFTAAANSSKISNPPKQIPVITGMDAAMYENTVLKLADVQGISTEYQLKKDNILVQDLDAVLGNGVISAMIPIVDNTGEKVTSYFAALFNKNDGNLINTMAIVYNKVDDNLYEGTFIKDGTKVLFLTVQKNGDIVKGYKVNSDGTTTNLTPGTDPAQTVNPNGFNSSFWDCFKNCLISCGVTAFAIAVIQATCATVCVSAPNPPGCAICAAACLLGFDAIIGYCEYQCW